MIISFIKNADCFYISLHAEEVFSSNYLKDSTDGISIQSLQFETLQRIYDFLEKKKTADIKCIVLDFKYIAHTQPNLTEKFVAFRKLGKIVFLNVEKTLIKPLSLLTVDNSNNVQNEAGGFDLFYFFSNDKDEIYDLKIKSREIFDASFLERIKNYVTPYKKKHTSSFVYLNSFIDLKKFISIERPFIYFALYRLAISINKHWEKAINEKPILVCQSLSSTFIVSILSKLLNLDILVFDKIGPITKLYNKIEKHNFEQRKYIIVSDLVCLGTEVKITKNLIEFSGGKYLGNVSLVKVETLNRDDLPLGNIDRTIATFSITRNNNKVLNYFIYTNLEPVKADTNND